MGKGEGEERGERGKRESEETEIFTEAKTEGLTDWLTQWILVMLTRLNMIADSNLFFTLSSQNCSYL